MLGASGSGSGSGVVGGGGNSFSSSNESGEKVLQDTQTKTPFQDDASGAVLQVKTVSTRSVGSISNEKLKELEESMLLHRCHRRNQYMVKKDGLKSENLRNSAVNNANNVNNNAAEQQK